MEESENTNRVSGLSWKTLIYVLPFLWLLAIVIALNFTSPIIIGPAGVLLVFCLIYGFLSTVFFIIFMIVSKLVKLFLNKSLPRKNLYYLASVVAFAPIFMIALNTLGQLGAVEVVLVVVLVLIGCFYVVKKRGAGN